MSAGRSFYGRREYFTSVDSTQRVVREWMEAGVPEVAVAVAEHQTAGRGRLARTWQAPRGAALLLSVGFRPSGLPLRHGWRLAATVALAMVDAAEAAAGLRDGTLWLKWPNDIVAEGADGPLKMAGVLGESVATGDQVAWSAVGIGVNGDWQRAEFPPDLAPMMASLRELAGGRPIDHEALLDEFLARLEPRYEALRGGAFDAAGWSVRQLTTGHAVAVDVGAGTLAGTALGVDPEIGGLIVETRSGRQVIDSGEVVRCRLA